jgi:hypothetical protein
MKISNELQSQVDRYGRTGSFNLPKMLKVELAAWCQKVQNKVLNQNCGTCVRNAMRDLYATQMIAEPKIKIKRTSFIGVLQTPISEMSYKELKALATDKGIKGNFKKAELIEMLTNG